MDKRQLWSPMVMPSWCCAVPAHGAFVASILGDIAVVPAVNPSFVAGSHGCRNLGASSDFLFPAWGGTRILWKEEPVGTVGESSFADTSEKRTRDVTQAVKM